MSRHEQSEPMRYGHVSIDRAPEVGTDCDDETEEESELKESSNEPMDSISGAAERMVPEKPAGLSIHGTDGNPS